MTDADRIDAHKAAFEALTAAYYSILPEQNDPFDDCSTLAYAALAGLEAAGFTLVRNRD